MVAVITSTEPRYFVDDQQKTKEIYEDRDCINNNLLSLPERTDLILKLIMDDFRLQQSCRRFHEAMMFRKNGSYYSSYSSSSIFLSAYEIIAYVASIEALLDTNLEKTEINCPNCGEFLYKEERKISEKFIKFVSKYGNSIHLAKFFKDIYKDRSMFVHTGLNLYNLGAQSMRPNRPLIIKGKNCIADLPSYYGNIHEHTGFLLRKYLYSKLFCELMLVD